MPGDLSGQRILITGGLGFIGSNLAHRCVEGGARVTVYDCLDPRSGGNMYNIYGIVDDIEIVSNDIRNFDGIAAFIRNKDIVFNCAAYTSHPDSMRDPFVDVDVNCKGTLNILEGARRFNREVKIVHVGTSTQIGRMQVSPVDELHPEFPVDIYSANKSASEKYVLIYAHAYRMRGTVLRLANVFGPRANIQNSQFGVINYFVGLALQDRAITVFGEGCQLRNVSYVDDCVSALILASQLKESDGEMFFAVGDRQYTIAEVASTIVKVMGRGGVRHVPWPKDRAAIEVGDAVISNAKIRRVLNWAPRHDLAEGMARTREYFDACLKEYLG